MISINTEDGMENGVKIIGPAKSGNKKEMRVKFKDGTVDDWEVEEFVKSTEPPPDLVRTQVRSAIRSRPSERRTLYLCV